MLVYTLTVNVDASVSEAWQEWMKAHLLEAMLDTGLFEKYHAFRVLHDSDGDTFTFQFFLKEDELFDHFQQEHKAQILNRMMNSFPDKVVYFNTLLRELA